jgi:threonine/homoserine/homoserine lactone efflux protein
MFAELGVEHIGLFIVTGWLLNLTPGPDVLYIVSNALRGGMRAGMVAAFGITAGCFVHIFAAGLGVSALLATSAVAFAVLKWVGAGYLLWVGVRLLGSKAPEELHWRVASGDAASAWSVFSKGFLTNALNPKVALFFLAFVPQFIAPGASHPTWAFLALGVLFNVNAIPVNMAYAVLAGWAAQRTAVVRKGLHWLDRLAGALFVGFGIKLALSAAPQA